MAYGIRTNKFFLQFSIVMLLAALLAAQVSSALAARKPGYEYYLTGNGADVTTPTAGGLVLMGGSTDVDAAFEWMIQQSGGGDFVIIRASGADGYNQYVYDFGGVDSVETLLITSREAASNPFVVEKIRNAEALFIAGGDQYNYVNFWMGTPVEDAIHQLVARNVPIGGTSAGLAILGEFLFSAENNTVDSRTALGDPYGRRIMLERDFLTLPNMSGIITDSHFVARDRMGRLMTFLARIVQDGWAAQAKGIGVDEQTAVVVDASGNARIMGLGAAYFLRTPGTPEVCAARTPLTYLNLSVYKLSGSATFNIPTWSGSGGVPYSLSVENGVVSSTQPGGGIY
jgi:cyanophycinase